MCGRPVEVPPRFAGKDFVHPLCGATLRMPVTREVGTDIELIATPELEETATIDLEGLRKSESHGLFLPRHLRENIPMHGDTSGEQLSAEGSPGEASARLAKALSQPPEGTAERIRKVRLARGTSDSSHLREKFNRTVDDLPGDISREGESESVDEPAGQSRQPENETVSMTGAGASSSAVAEKMNGVRKLAIVVFVFIALAAVILMMVNFVPGD